MLEILFSLPAGSVPILLRSNSEYRSLNSWVRCAQSWEEKRRSSQQTLSSIARLALVSLSSNEKLRAVLSSSAKQAELLLKPSGCTDLGVFENLLFTPHESATFSVQNMPTWLEEQTSFAHVVTNIFKTTSRATSVEDSCDSPSFKEVRNMGWTKRLIISCLILNLAGLSEGKKK